MKLRTMILSLILATVPAFAQNTTPQTPPPTNPQASQGAQRRANMRAMHEQHMQQMKQGIEKMKALLQEMKNNAAGMTGKDKAAMDANIQLWQMMIDHMEDMMNHMSSMGTAGPGMMHKHGPNSMRNKPAPPTPPAEPPAPQQ